MSNTVKRYLLPSEIEGVLRSGAYVYARNGDMESRYTWTPEAGIKREWRTDKVRTWRTEEKPNNAAPRKFVRDDLASWDCYVIALQCECGKVLDLNGNCCACDDNFG